MRVALTSLSEVTDVHVVKHMLKTSTLEHSVEFIYMLLLWQIILLTFQ